MSAIPPLYWIWATFRRRPARSVSKSLRSKSDERRISCPPSRRSTAVPKRLCLLRRACKRQPDSNQHPGGRGAAADDARVWGLRRSGRPDVLWSKLPGPVPAHRRLCRQDSARGEAGRYSSRAADQVRSHHQSDDRQGAWSNHPRIVPVARRRGDRVSNCVVGSGGSRLPCSTIAEHGVEGCDHFSHDGDDDDLGFFVGGDEAFVEGFEGGTVTACAEGGHVEDVTDRHPTTIDAAVSLELAAVEVIRCEADEGGDLFAAHLPEFWQQGDEREGQHRADAWHRGQQLIALSESHIGGNHLGQALVEEADIGLQSHLAAFAEPPQHGIFVMSRLVL